MIGLAIIVLLILFFAGTARYFVRILQFVIALIGVGILLWLCLFFGALLVFYLFAPLIYHMILNAR